MTRIGMTFALYFFVFITKIDSVNIFLFLFLYMLRYPYPYVMYTSTINIFTDFFDICHKQMLIYN